MNGINSLVLSLKLNGLPSSLVQAGLCPQCANLFTVQTSINNTFKATTQYNGVSSIDGQALFNVNLVFDYFPTTNFNVYVKINSTMASLFTVDVTQPAIKMIDLRTLSKAESSSNMRKDNLN